MSTRNQQLFSLLVGLSIAIYCCLNSLLLYPDRFNGYRSFQDIREQLSFGPRIPGSVGHENTATYIISSLQNAGWHTIIEDNTWNGLSARNILAYRSTISSQPEILLGAHYDTRPIADMDQNIETSRPVPGGNDGASGVAVLLEMARILPRQTNSVWLVFFDGEDGAGLPGNQGIVGSRAFADQFTPLPKSVVIVDMVGDIDLDLYQEYTSDPGLTNEIWTYGFTLGYTEFIPLRKYSIIDDHTPFLAKGVPSVVLIDFDYPYWHTSMDTLDKVSPHSLEVVGETLRLWIINKVGSD
jgi:glutaminyl-peptide cyclotransferase